MEIFTKERDAVERAHPIFDGNHKEIDRKTIKILLYLGFSPKLNGYTYICCAILLILNDREYLKNLTSNLYPKIAKKYSVKTHCVERSIRHALDAAIANGRMKRFNKIIGTEVYDDKIRVTNGEFLSLIAESIKLEDTSVEKSR